MTCQEFERMVNLYIDGMLDEEDALRVREHMEGCPPCRAMYDSLVQVVEELGRLEDMPLPEGFEDRLRSSLKPARAVGIRWWKQPVLWTGVAAALVVMFVGLSGGARSSLGTGERDMATTKAAAADMAVNTAYSEYAMETTAAAMAMVDDGAVVETMELALEQEPVSGGSGRSLDQQSRVVVSEEKLIYTADVAMRSYSFDQDYAALKEQVSAMEGYIDSNSVEGLPFTQSGGQGRSGSLKLRIPQKNYRAMMEWLGRLGEVTSTRENVTNITAQYTQTQIRRDNLAKQVARLQELVGQAKDIDDIFMLEAELANTTSQLEYIETTLNTMDHDVSYSTVNVSMQEMRTAADMAPASERSFWQRAGDALSAGWNGFLRGMESFALNVVSALPVVLLVAAVAAVVIVLITVRRKKRK